VTRNASAVKDKLTGLGNGHSECDDANPERVSKCVIIQGGG
jgi:hypothetical protein